jgi:hypothetical protein
LGRDHPRTAVETIAWGRRIWIEDDTPAEDFDSPKHPRLQEFLSNVL